MVHDYTSYLNLGIELAKKVGKNIKAAHGNPQNVQTKDLYSFNMVTDTDIEVENFLIHGIKEQYPDHEILAEESYPGHGKYSMTNEPTWIIDPLDGTTNFVHGLPMVAISIGLFIEKTPALGIIYNPVTDDLYTAIKGQGAFRNGQPIKVSGQKELKKSLVCYDIVYLGIPVLDERRIRNVVEMSKIVHGQRILGSAALSLAAVAAGKVDAYFESGIRAWDMAAGCIIIEEAGGCVLDPEGGPFDVLSRRIISAGSEALARTLVEKLEHNHEFPRD